MEIFLFLDWYYTDLFFYFGGDEFFTMVFGTIAFFWVEALRLPRGWGGVGGIFFDFSIIKQNIS